MTVKRNPMQTVGQPNSSVVNLLEPKVVKSYENKPAAEPHVPQVILGKPSKELTTETSTTPEASATETAAPATETEDKSAADKRAERRDSFKEADKAYQRAMAMQKEAAAKLDQAKKFAELQALADSNPIELAKALGKDPTEFLRKYQTNMFGLKDEEPAADVKSELDKYAKEREADRQAMHQMQFHINKNNYIKDKILPELTKDPDKYELITKKNLDGNASLMYDIMNEHYQKYGEELTAAEVADEMEAGLMKEVETSIKNAKEFKKLAAHFRVDEATVQAIAEATAKPELSKKEEVKPKTISNNLGSNAPASVTNNSAKSYGHDRNSRLKRVLDKYK